MILRKRGNWTFAERLDEGDQVLPAELLQEAEAYLSEHADMPTSRLRGPCNPGDVSKFWAGRED